MTLSVQAMSVDIYVAMLTDLSKILDKAADYARAEGIDPATLLGARLAPDMYDFAKQVRVACDGAANAAAHLAGREPPAPTGEDASFEALKARIARTIDYVSGFDAKALEGGEARAIVIPTPLDFDFAMTGEQFVKDWSLPNLFFHVTTAYCILRHEGVPIGKQDFLGHAAGYIRPKVPA